MLWGGKWRYRTFKKIADITTFDEYNNLVKEAVKTGLSYPASCTKALQHFANINPEVLAMPNNILAIEYIKQAHKLGLFNLQMQAIKRQGNDYNDENLSQTFSSAKAIRIALSQKNINPKNLQIPQYVEQDLQNSAIDYNKYLALIASKAIELNEVYEDNEGILNRIKKYALQANSYDELVDLAHTKRYTKSKIKRIMAHIVLSHKASDLKPIGKPQVLAIKKDKKHLLSCIDFSGNDDLINIDKYSNKIYNIISKDKITNEKMLIIE